MHSKLHFHTARLKGFKPSLDYFELYRDMFQDPDFVKCYGVCWSDEYIQKFLTRDTAYWKQYGFGPLVWFDKDTGEFIGEGGLNHTTVENQPEIELTYSLQKEQWGKGFAGEN